MTSLQCHNTFANTRTLTHCLSNVRTHGQFVSLFIISLTHNLILLWALENPKLLTS